MPNEPDRVMLDTNVLVYAMNASDNHHARCRVLRDSAFLGEANVCTTPQVLYEYLAVVTNPNSIPEPLSSSEACDDIRDLGSAFPVIYPTVEAHERVLHLLRETSFSGRHVFDLLLAATMLANGVTRIYSYDDRFDRIPGIQRLEP